MQIRNSTRSFILVVHDFLLQFYFKSYIYKSLYVKLHLLLFHVPSSILSIVTKKKKKKKLDPIGAKGSFVALNGRDPP